MDAQPAYPHDPNIFGHQQHHEEEDENHHEKKSVLKKVKAKAKKIKDTIKKHVHEHDHDHGYEYQRDHVPDDHDLDEEDDDDDDDEEIVEDPEVHGAPMYESAAVKSSVSGQPEDLSRPGITYERLKASRPDPLTPIESDHKTLYSGDYESKDNQSTNSSVPGLGFLVKEQPRVDFGKPTATFEEPLAPQNTPVPSSHYDQTRDANPTKTFVHGQEEDAGQPKVILQRPKGLEEDPAAPKDTPDVYTTTNYQTKVTDPTGKGGEATLITPILHSLDKMNLHDTQDTGREQNLPTGTHQKESEDSKLSFPTGSHDQFSPEPTPPISNETSELYGTQDTGRVQNLPLGTHHKASENSEISFPTESHDKFSPEPTPPIRNKALENPPLVSETMDATNPQDHPHNIVSEKPLNQSSYTEKISSATSAIADKAVSAKNIVASKLGYGEKDQNQTTTNESHEGQDATKKTSAVDYGKKMAATVTEKLTPVYEKVAGAGSTVMSKLHGPGKGTATEVGTDQVQQQDKGVSMKGYIAEKLKPSEEDKVLSEVISDALHKRNDHPEDETKARGKVTESEEVAKLGTVGQIDEKAGSGSGSGSMNSPTTSMVDKLKGTVGSWFGKSPDESQGIQQAHDSSYDNEGISNTSTAGERRLQESGN